MLTLAVYLPLVLWLSLWIGLKMRTRFRAILTALGVIVAWCAGPALLLFAFDLDPHRSSAAALLAMASPLLIPGYNETSILHQLFPRFPWLGVLANFAVYAAIVALIRRWCLECADRYLRGA